MRPSDFGITNPKFKDTFRPEQIEAIQMGLDIDTRFLCLSLPPGGGKSLVAAALSQVYRRTVILTPNKGLQDQYVADDPNHELYYPIKGRSNYDCAQHGDCHRGRVLGCGLNGTPDCDYSYHYGITQDSNVVANYAHWISILREGKGSIFPYTDPEALASGHGDPIRCLILDEAHDAFEELGRQLEIRLSKWHLDKMGWYGDQPHGEDYRALCDWRDWAKSRQADIKLEAQGIRKQYPKGSRVPPEIYARLSLLDSMLGLMVKIADTDPDNWVLEEKNYKGQEWNWNIIWPASKAEQYLFAGVPLVVLMSGTLPKKNCTMLNIKPEQMTYKEWDRIFPEENSPVTYWPVRRTGSTKSLSKRKRERIESGEEDGKMVAVRVGHNMSDADMQLWQEHIDHIISVEGLEGMKGLIDTVSYKRQQYLMERSKYRKFMVGNTGEPDSETALEVGMQFKKMEAPRILISPSFSTGWDFPGKQCEWIIISKIPFPHQKSKVVITRSERDPQYPMLVAMNRLQQTSLRGSRTPTDVCRVYIVDGQAEWFLGGLWSNRSGGGRNKWLACKWWRVRYRELGQEPRTPCISTERISPSIYKRRPPPPPPDPEWLKEWLKYDDEVPF